MVLIALLTLGTVAAAQPLTPVPFERNVPVSVAQDQEWSWHGLPLGPADAAGVRYEIGQPTASAEAVMKTPSSVLRPLR